MSMSPLPAAVHRIIRWSAWSLLVVLCSAPLSAGDLFFDSDGVKIRYAVDGDGPPVVLVHGFGATGDLNWRLPGVTARLAEQYYVIALDNRGHGRSDKPTDPAAYGAQMVGDVVRLLDHLKLKTAHLVGYSMGGMIALKMAVTHPERVRSAVIGGMGWLETGSEDAGHFDVGGPAQEQDPLAACFRSLAGLAITRAELEGIGVPMTVVIGASDPLLVRRVEPLREVRSDVPVVVVPEATHMNCMFKEPFRTAVCEFLDEQAADDPEVRKATSR